MAIRSVCDVRWRDERLDANVAEEWLEKIRSGLNIIRGFGSVLGN